MFWNRKNIVTKILPFYDKIVNDINCKYIWKCNKENIFKLYKKNIKKNHLEIGPGTGYFLKKYTFSNLYLMDINKDILLFSKKELEKNNKNIKIYHHNIFQKKLYLNNIDSIGINYVLHCIDGNLENKIELLHKNLRTKKDVVIFGATVINIDKYQNSLAKIELDFLNYFGIFHNKEDNFENVIKYFEENKIEFYFEIIGNVFLFSFIKHPNS